MVDQSDIDARSRRVRTWYDGHVFKCQLFQPRIQSHLVKSITKAGLEDARVESRTKGVDSLVEKAVKLAPSGDFKYAEPEREITDTVGVRITVPLSTDLVPVAQLVRDTYDVEEELERGDEESHLDVPGYRSLHFLVRLRDEEADDPDLAPFADMVIEIQVRTTLQHAWATLQHDVMYKAERPPTPMVKRRLVALAGLLELADREFVQVRQAHADVRDATPVVADRPGGRLTASSLRHLAETMFGEEDTASHEWFVELKEVTDSLQLLTVEGLRLRAGGVARARADGGRGGASLPAVGQHRLPPRPAAQAVAGRAVLRGATPLPRRRPDSRCRAGAPGIRGRAGDVAPSPRANVTDVLLALGVIVLGGLVAAVVFLAREQKITTSSVRALAALCALGLVSMLLTDWPSEVLARFWADHSVVAGVLSTVLLVGIVFLAFEDSERRRQEQLDSSVTAAGLGGIVDHVVDAEIALALLSRSGPPSDVGWATWDHPGRPLRWLRDRRHRFHRSENGRPTTSDPRSVEPGLPEVADAAWRVDVVDQAVRRLLAAIRDWAPVIRGSRNGVLVLIAIAEIRKDLMSLGISLQSDPGAAPPLMSLLRQRLRLLAHFLETTSGARPPRLEVLTTMDPLPLWSDELDWAADPDGRATFGEHWRQRMGETMREVNRHA